MLNAKCFFYRNWAYKRIQGIQGIQGPPPPCDATTCPLADRMISQMPDPLLTNLRLPDSDTPYISNISEIGSIVTLDRPRHVRCAHQASILACQEPGEAARVFERLAPGSSYSYGCRCTCSSCLTVACAAAPSAQGCSTRAGRAWPTDFCRDSATRKKSVQI